MKHQLFFTALMLLITFKSFAQKTVDNDDKSWPGFFKILQTAVKSGDKNKIMSLCDFSVMNKDDFNENYEFFFLDDAKKSFAKAKQNDAKKTKFELEGLTNATEFYQLTFNYNEKDEDGEVEESSIIYYFAKVKGRFRIVNLELAG
jgi:hypothetical protein